MTAKHSNDIGDRILMIVLALILLSASVAVSVQFLKPDGRREHMDAIIQDCLGILTSAQKWYRSSSVVGGGDRKDFSKLRFEKLGYVERVSADGRSMSNEHARFTLRVADDGKTFDLIAEGRGGALIIYRGVDNGPIPDPEIR